MATTRNGKNGQLQQLVLGAQKRLNALEGGANKVVKGLLARGKSQRKELEALIEKFDAGELFDPKSVRKLGKRATQTSTQVRKRLDAFQARVVEASGVASQSQIRELNRELTKLSKKLDTLVGKGRSKTDFQA